MAIANVKDLQDMIFLLIGFFLLVQGVRVFLDRERRQKATEVIQAILMLLLGLFIVSIWFSSLRYGASNNQMPANLGGGYEGLEGLGNE
jgi:hypothetical protein